MSDTRDSYDDEIDLFELFKTLWEGRWVIFGTTIVAAICGIVFSFLQPNSFKGATTLDRAQNSTFTKHLSVNETLNRNGFDYSINSQAVFNLFVAEFGDYKEVIEVLNDNN